MNGLQLRIKARVAAVFFTFAHLYLMGNFSLSFFETNRVPSGVNVEGAEVHGLSMGKKSPPKIDRDLREGMYIQVFMSMKTEEQSMAGKP